MATVTEAITVRSEVRGNTVRHLFRYTLDNGEIHERRAWVPVNTDEATERSARQSLMLTELAEAEAARLMAEG
jgi:hypothetical protein